MFLRGFRWLVLSCKLIAESTRKHFHDRICWIRRLASISYRYEYNNLSFPFWTHLIINLFNTNDLNVIKIYDDESCRLMSKDRLLRLVSVSNTNAKSWKVFLNRILFQFYFSFFFLFFHHSIDIDWANLS